MDVSEYNEVRWPTRALQQEEEEDAAATAEQDLAPPQTQWASSGPVATPQLLVIATSPATCALLRSAIGQDAQAVGSVQSAPPAAAGGAGAAAALYSPAPGVLLCCCDAALPPQRAPAWAQAVLGALQPASRLLVLGTLQAEQYRGEADASQELLAFVLQTTAAREQQQQAPVAPYLPSGSIASGLQAALLARAELAGLAAELLVVVEQVPSLVPEMLQELAELVQAALGRAGSGGGAWASGLSSELVVAAARAQLQRSSYRPSSVYS